MSTPGKLGQAGIRPGLANVVDKANDGPQAEADFLSAIAKQTGPVAYSNSTATGKSGAGGGSGGAGWQFR